MKKAFIFDLDGVLCFTDKFHFRAWKIVCDKLGIAFDEKINDRLRGVSRTESLEIILSLSGKTLSDGQKIEIAEEKNEVYRQFLSELKGSDISDEVRTTLATLRGREYKLAVGSSSKNTPLILEKTDMKKYFDAVSDGNGLVRSKPDPEVFLKAAALLGLAPSECYVVEDAAVGIEAGRKGGFSTVGYGAAAKCGNADYAIENFCELLEIDV